MKIEEAPYEGAPSPTLTSSPAGHVKDGRIEHSSHSGVTSLAISIPPPNNVRQVTQSVEKKKNETYWKIQILLYAGIDPNLKAIDSVFLTRMAFWVRRREDKKMIISAEKLGNYFRLSIATATAGLRRLERGGYLKRTQRGDGRGNASKYVLGEIYSEAKRDWIKEQLRLNDEGAKPKNFVRTKPKGRPRGIPLAKGKRVQKLVPFTASEQRIQTLANKGSKNLLAHPILQPIEGKGDKEHTRLTASSRSFSLDNWMTYGRAKADWEDSDMRRSYELAKAKPYISDETWEASADFYYREYKRHQARYSDRDDGAKAPPLDDWLGYAKEIGLAKIKAESFYDYYLMIGWRIGGRVEIENWKALARKCLTMPCDD